MLKVYFIGAGPGDPELLTLKAVKMIKRADIVIYAGSLVNKSILSLVKQSARIYDSSRMNLNEITGIFEKQKHSSKIIARIHSGEPSIYGAIQEQMDYCDEKKITFEVIPGISSFQAAAAALKQELTLAGVSQTVILSRLSGRTRVPPRENLTRLAKIRATMIIFLSILEIEKVVRKLKSGYSSDTPVAVLERVSFPKARIIRGTLKDISEKIKSAEIKRQALIIVGDVLRKKYQKSKLYDKNFSHSFRK